MDESLEADLILAHLVPFARGRAVWLDAYVGWTSRLQPGAEPALVAVAAERAWCTHSWAHPVVVAQLEHQLGPLGDA